MREEGCDAYLLQIVSDQIDLLVFHDYWLLGEFRIQSFVETGALTRREARDKLRDWINTKNG